MTRKQKKREQFLSQPKSVAWSDISTILLDVGCVRIPAKGSHVKFKHPYMTHDLIIPVHNNECKDFYKVAALSFIREIESKTI